MSISRRFFIASARSSTPTYNIAPTILVDSPLGYWRLNDAHGATTFADSSGNARDLTSGGTILAGLTPIFAGSSGCVQGDGDSSLAVNTDNVFDITGDMTFECVISFQSLPPSGAQWTFCSCTPTAASELEVDNTLYFWGIENSGGTYRLFFFHENGAGTNNSVSLNWTPSTNTPYHIVIVRDTTAKTHEVFVNGASIGTSGAYTTNPTGGGASGFAILGVRDDTTAVHAHFQGLMAEAAIYSSKLSSARISAHYDALGGAQSVPTTYQSQVLADSPYSYWHLNRSTGVTCTDQGSGFNLLTSSGATVNQAGLATDTGKAWLLGSGDTCTVASSAGFQYVGSLTFEFLVNFASLPSSGTSYFFVNTSASGETEATNAILQLALSNSGGNYTLAWFHESGAGTNSSGSVSWVTPSTGVVYHIAIVRDVTANTYEFFVNGASLGSSSYTNDPTGGTSTTFRVGSAFDGTSSVIGTLDEVALYKSALSSVRIDDHYKAL